MRIVFFGSPDFAAVSLRALLDSEHEVLAVVSQPDRAKGRSGKKTPTATAALALDMGLPVMRPDKVRDKEFGAELEKFGADIFVVVSYGQFLPTRLLDMPRHGAINVHASLLPKYRGASPIASAILNGDAATGCCIMQMDQGMDTGPVLHSRDIPIDDADTAGTLTEKLADLGGQALLEALDKIAIGRAVAVPQDNALATHAPLLTKDMGRIDFTKTAAQIHNQVRGMDPWPGAFMDHDGTTLKVWRADIVREGAKPLGMGVACADGFIDLLEVQAPGGRRIPTSEYLRGRR